MTYKTKRKWCKGGLNMIFNDLDRWMLQIERTDLPTARERRQHVKLEALRDKTYVTYLKRFKYESRHNQCPCPMVCSERVFDRAHKMFLQAGGNQ